MSKELLLHIISEVHNIGFKVVAMVSDMGPSNMGLWRDFGICTENTRFKHPVEGTKVHVFADVPHLLKLARNHFFDKSMIIYKHLSKLYKITLN